MDVHGAEACLAELLKPDICVIGAGSGGLSVAAAAAAFGVSVVQPTTAPQRVFSESMHSPKSSSPVRTATSEK